MHALVLETFLHELTAENLLLLHKIVESCLVLFTVAEKLVHELLGSLSLRLQIGGLLQDSYVFKFLLFEFLVFLVDLLLELLDLVLGLSAHHLLSLYVLRELCIKANQLSVLLLVLPNLLVQLINFNLKFQKVALLNSAVFFQSLNRIRDSLNLVLQLLEHGLSHYDLVGSLSLFILHMVHRLLDVGVSLLQTRRFVFLFRVVAVEALELVLHHFVVFLGLRDF